MQAEIATKTEKSPADKEWARAMKAQAQSATAAGRAKLRAELAKKFPDEIADYQALHGETHEQALERLLAEHEELNRQIVDILAITRAAA
jgi:hypothetical protein